MRPDVRAAIVDVVRSLGALAKALEGEAPAPTTSALIALRDCGVPVTSLRAAIRAGELAAVKIGREFLVERAELDRWIASRAVRPKTIKREAAPTTELDVDREIDEALARGRLRVVRGRRP